MATSVANRVSANEASDRSSGDDALGEIAAFFGPLNFGLANMLPEMIAGKTRRDLSRCGYSHPVCYENFLALRNFLFCASVVLTAIWYLAVMDQPSLARIVIIGGGITAVLLLTLPRVLISIWGESRVRRVSAGLPDGLDLIAMAMSGGMPFQQALAHSASELAPTHADLSQEFVLISRQTMAGSIEYGFERFAQRMDWPELQTTLDSLLHAIQLGTSLRLTLEQLADRSRLERLRRATDRANRNVIMMLFPMVLCLAPAALILVFMPPLLKLKEFRDEANRDGGVLSRKQVSQQFGRGPTPIRSPQP